MKWVKVVLFTFSWWNKMINIKHYLHICCLSFRYVKEHACKSPKETIQEILNLVWIGNTHDQLKKTFSLPIQQGRVQSRVFYAWNWKSELKVNRNRNEDKKGTLLQQSSLLPLFSIKYATWLFQWCMLMTNGGTLPKIHIVFFILSVVQRIYLDLSTTSLTCLMNCVQVI